MADFVCTEMEAFHRNAQPQKELLRSTGVWGVHQQVSSGKVDSQANCLLKLWYQQALLAASLESI